jgi:hypothetical protein
MMVAKSDLPGHKKRRSSEACAFSCEQKEARTQGSLTSEDETKAKTNFPSVLSKLRFRFLIQKYTPKQAFQHRKWQVPQPEGP